MVTKTKSLIKDALCVEGLYGDSIDDELSWELQLIDFFKLALCDLCCNISHDEADVRTDYMYQGKSVAVTTVWCDMEDDGDYTLQRLDVSKEFARTHCERLVRIILPNWILESILQYQIEHETDLVSDEVLERIAEKCTREVDEIFGQL